MAAAVVASFTSADAMSPGVALAADRDCSDFDDRREAQRFFERHSPSIDPHNLDRDGDGVACESLPCPCGHGFDGGEGPYEPGRQHARAKRAIDGDTVEVRLRGRTPRVRLLGIDAPEVLDRDECGGPQARASLGRLLDPGEDVTLIRDPGQPARDGLGQLLRYVKDGRKDWGRRQLLRGWAKTVDLDGPAERTREYRSAQRRAKEGQRGVWGRCGGNFHQEST